MTKKKGKLLEILFRKRYSTLTKNEKIKRLEIYYAFALLANVFFMLIAFQVLYLLINGTYYFNLEANPAAIINTSDLDASDAQLANSLIDSLDSSYLIGQKSITFTYNLSKYTPRDTQGWLGFNNNNEIYVRFQNSGQAKVTLCHELLHTYFLRDEIAHKIVYTLASKGVCYEKN